MLSAVTITCPRCGLVFETNAVTNTRCRRCRHVVNIGRRSRSVEPGLSEDDQLSETGQAGSALTGSVIGLGLVAAGAFGLWRGWHLPTEGEDSETLRRRRRRWLVGSGLVAALGVTVVVVSRRSDNR